MTPKQVAYHLMRHYRINQMTLDNAHYIATELGYEIIDYDPKRLTKTMSLLVKELSIPPEVLQQNAFTVHSNSTNLIFISERLTPDEKRLALIHEIGHVILGHLQNPQSLPSVSAEHDANEFVHYILNPSLAFSLSILAGRHIRTILIIAAVIAGLSVLGWIVNYEKTEQTMYGDYYITESGNKYHIHDCSVIRNKQNIRRLTVDEYESGKYTPCKVCIPEQ